MQGQRSESRSAEQAGPRKNQYYPAFDLLLAKLLATEKAVHVAKTAFADEKFTSAELATRAKDRPFPSGWLADICEDRMPGYVRYVLSLRDTDASKGSYLHAARNFRTSSYLWAIARSFEAFREFVEAIAHSLPYQEKPFAYRLLTRAVRLVSRRPKRAKRGFDAALKRVRKAAPLLKRCETGNSRGIHLAQWIRVVAAVRHAVAHNEGILRDFEFEKYRSSNLESEFPGSREDEVGYVLTPTHDVALKTIQRLREYALVIYKAVSEAATLPTLIYDHEKGITTWSH